MNAPDASPGPEVRTITPGFDGKNPNLSKPTGFVIGRLLVSYCIHFGSRRAQKLSGNCQDFRGQEPLDRCMSSAARTPWRHSARTSRASIATPWNADVAGAVIEATDALVDRSRSGTDVTYILERFRTRLHAT